MSTFELMIYYFVMKHLYLMKIRTILNTSTSKINYFGRFLKKDKHVNLIEYAESIQTRANSFFVDTYSHLAQKKPNNSKQRIISR